LTGREHDEITVHPAGPYGSQARSRVRNEGNPVAVQIGPAFDKIILIPPPCPGES
jgi:hypothetical protein